MTRHHSHGYGVFGVLAIGAAIAYAFGNKAARTVIGALLIFGGFVGLVAAILFAYVCYRVVMGTI